jgi:hypothetical protein
MTASAVPSTTVRVVTTDGRTLALRPAPLASGAEKTAFLTVDGREVVAFYWGQLRNRHERVERLQRIVTSYNPTRGQHGTYWSHAFCWPTNIVDGSQSINSEFVRTHSLVQPALGVVMPVYRDAFFMQDRFGNRVEKEVR